MQKRESSASGAAQLGHCIGGQRRLRSSVFFASNSSTVSAPMSRNAISLCIPVTTPPSCSAGAVADGGGGGANLSPGGGGGANPCPGGGAGGAGGGGGAKLC